MSTIERGRRIGLIFPSMLFLAVFFLVPIGEVLRWSFADDQGSGFTLANFEDFLGANTYVILTFRTLLVAGVVAISCLVLGYLVALQIYRLRPKLRTWTLMAIVTPMWLSVLVRTYAWMVVIGRDGLINRFLIDFGVVDHPLKMLFTRGAVYVTMTQILLPIVVLSSFSAMTTVDPTLVRAARIMGAGRLKAFARVFLPLTATGALNGAALVFVLCLGFFVTPALVGGPNDSLVANVITNQVVQTLEWNGAAVLSIFLIGMALIIMTPTLGLVRFILPKSYEGGRK
ncbi:MAG: ABC transporter permease [Paraburkholderia sp.]|jgi:putative spermidine/putrescine transport system permease protein|nr:ABC transporter permease [Paraburkholderia sp.]